MITIRQLRHHLSQFDQDLRVVFRLDTFVPAENFTSPEAQPEWEHLPDWRHRSLISAKDIFPVWDHSTQTVCIEIADRLFVPIVPGAAFQRALVALPASPGHAIGSHTNLDPRLESRTLRSKCQPGA